MKMMNRLMALVMALLLCCGCALAETAPATSPDDVMATVNGVEILRSKFDAYVLDFSNYYTSMGYDMTSEANQSVLKEIALMTLVQYAIMDQKITEMGVQLTDEEVADASQLAREEWEAVINSGLQYYGATAESTDAERAAILVQVLAELESMGYTEQGYIDDAVLNAAYIKLENEIIKDVTVSDEEVIAHYNSLVEADEIAFKTNAAAYEETQYMNQMYLAYGMTEYYTDLYYVPEGYRSVTHILLDADETLLTAYANLQATYEEQQSAIEEGTEVTEPLVTEEDVENARLAILAAVQPTVDEINQKLAEGATFAELIPLYTKDPGMDTAEEIAQGYDVHMDSTNWVIPFRDAAFTVDNIGDVTAPVVTDYGVHILQYVADIPGGPVELTEDLMATLRITLLEPQQSAKLNDTMSQWMAEAQIVYSAEVHTLMVVEETVEAPVE